MAKQATKTAPPQSKKPTKAEKQNDRLKKRFEKLQAGEFATRLEKLKREATRTTPEEMYLFLNPAQVAQAAEKADGRLPHMVEAIRNALVLLPLFVTWLSLGLAGVAYTENITLHKELSNEPFLQQWGEGFRTLGVAAIWRFRIPLLLGNKPWFTFAHVALLDVALIFLLILLTVWLYRLEWSAHTTAVQLGAWVDQELYKLSEESLHRWGKTPEDTQRSLADKMAEAMTKLEKALEELKAVMQQDVTESVSKFRAALVDQGAAVDRYIKEADKIQEAIGDLHELYGESTAISRKLGDTLPKMEEQVEGLATNQSQSAAQIEQAAKSIQTAASEMRAAAVYIQGGSLPPRVFPETGASGGFGQNIKNFVRRVSGRSSNRQP